MRRISAYSISLWLILIGSMVQVHAQDTVLIPLKIKVGFEVIGPVNYLTNKNNLSTEAFFSVDMNEKRSVVIEAGYLNYKYSQYNYDYFSNGVFMRSGVDFNLLKPEVSTGKYYGGIGLRYGISRFTSETPSFKHENYWGTATSSIPSRTSWGHFVEVSPGVRAEVFKNFSMGWTVSLRMLLYTGAGKDLRPIYFPGFGNSGKTFSTGINYFISWNIPYKKITVIIKKDVPEETEEKGETVNGQPATGIRP
jgi:hypothetical protein